MAGDWIKIETCLPDKPEVMRLSELLDVNEMQVVGHLVKFWSWCDQNMSLDCPVVSGTKRGLDRVAMRDGFVDAMVTVGWLEVDGDGAIQIPNYESHLSKSAKQRAQDSKKKQKQRENAKKQAEAASQICPDASGTTAGQNRGLEKRREEKSILDNRAELVLSFWNESMGKNIGWTESRKRAIRQRLKDADWLKNWREAIVRIRSSSFCQGENDKGWKADFDFFLRPDTVTKTMEGKYDDKRSASAAMSQAKFDEEFPDL